MGDSDEEKVLLEDDSMDEMHELEDDLVTSIDTNASPAKLSMANTRRRYEASGADDGRLSDSDDSEWLQGSSSSDESDTRQRSWNFDRIAPPGILGRDSDEDEDGEDDEPPEIPGSPIRSTTGDDTAGHGLRRAATNGSDSARARSAHNAPTVNILKIHTDNSDDDEYETKETEAPRAMEFHGSSSSSDSEREATENSEDDDDRIAHHASKREPHTHQHERPKTAAKELSLYRGVVPTEYYEQIVQDAPTSPKTNDAAQSKMTGINARNPKPEPDHEREGRQRVPSAATPPLPTKYKVRVPSEIEELFQYVHAYTPDVVDIPTHLQPFIPEYVPIVGLPFDGIQIPRPDNKPDSAGIAFVREPWAQSNAAELELLLAARTKTQRRKRHLHSVERVHSIEDASHRSRDIDHWIASVAKVQASTPPLRVVYKKPMPSETSLMELWPEPFEEFLVSQPPLPISQMNLDLPETIRVVCGVLDIPVYDGLHVHSLYALFSLYHEVVSYEKELLGNHPTT